MIDLYPFAGLSVAVLGLDASGRAAAAALASSGVDVWAWDDEEALRARAQAEGIAIVEPGSRDWREAVSLVVAEHIPHGAAPHAVVAAARDAGLELISDAELLARAQRDAAYVGLAARGEVGRALDMVGHVLRLSAREVEAGGDEARPILNLHPLDDAGAYVLAMPPGRTDLTLSITFDVAVLLDLGREAWPPCADHEETAAAIRWLFHRQTGPRSAVINADDAGARPILDGLREAGEQIVVPISGRARTPGGVYVAGGRLPGSASSYRICRASG